MLLWNCGQPFQSRGLSHRKATHRKSKKKRTVLSVVSQSIAWYLGRTNVLCLAVESTSATVQSYKQRGSWILVGLSLEERKWLCEFFLNMFAFTLKMKQAVSMQIDGSSRHGITKGHSNVEASVLITCSSYFSRTNVPWLSIHTSLELDTMTRHLAGYRRVWIFNDRWAVWEMGGVMRWFPFLSAAGVEWVCCLHD